MKRKIFQIAKEWTITIFFTVIIYFGLTTYVVQATEVITGSMIPTVNVKERIIVAKFLPPSTYSFGDIIVFHPPIEEDQGIPFVKRLIGLPGDTIEIRDGKLIRNGQIVDEPYLKETMRYEYGPITVPEGKYFFLGDNRNNSKDSHLWANPFIDEDRLIGKAFMRYFPIKRIGGL